jgi:hypothetical protein
MNTPEKAPVFLTTVTPAIDLQQPKSLTAPVARDGCHHQSNICAPLLKVTVISEGLCIESMCFASLCVASVELTLLERSVYDSIECPGDKILYNCSVESNSENVQLTWVVTFSDSTTFNKTYYNISDNITDGTMNDLGISTVLTRYVEDQYIESLITFTVLDGVHLNGSVLTCRSNALDESSVDVYVNTTGETSLMVIAGVHNAKAEECTTPCNSRIIEI